LERGWSKICFLMFDKNAEKFTAIMLFFVNMYLDVPNQMTYLFTIKYVWKFFNIFPRSVYKLLLIVFVIFLSVFYYLTYEGAVDLDR
jgi:fatty acid desaturase